MLLGPFLADVLSDLQLAQLADQPRPEYQREEHCGEAGVNRAHGDVPEHVEWREVALQQVVEKVVEHLSGGPLRAPRPPRRDARATGRRSFPSSRHASPLPAADPRRKKATADIRPPHPTSGKISRASGRSPPTPRLR